MASAKDAVRYACKCGEGFLQTLENYESVFPWTDLHESHGGITIVLEKEGAV